MSYAKTKGKKFETKIANEIHEHLKSTNPKYCKIVEMVDNDNVLPKRDSSSGIFTTSNGDIELGIAKPFFPFSVECKDHKDLDLSINSIFKSKIKKLYDIWYHQCIPNARKASLTPLMIFKANRTETFTICNIESININKCEIYIKLKDDLVMVLFEDFLKFWKTKNKE
jgi:hypothetical protein